MSAGTATVLRGKSSADAIQLLCSRETLLQSDRQIGPSSRTVCTSAPGFHERLRHEHPATHTNGGDIPNTGGLIGDRIGSACATGRLKKREQRFAINDGWHHVPPPVRLRIDRTHGDGILGLSLFDAKERQDRAAHIASHARMSGPHVQRSTTGSGRLPFVAMPSEKRVEQVDCSRLYLFDLNARYVDRLPRVAPDPHRVIASVDADIAVRVDHPCCVSEVYV